MLSFKIKILHVLIHLIIVKFIQDIKFLHHKYYYLLYIFNKLDYLKSLMFLNFLNPKLIYLNLYHSL